MSMLLRAAIVVHCTHSEDDGLSAEGLGEDRDMGASRGEAEEDKLAAGGVVAADGEEDGPAEGTYGIMAAQVDEGAAEEWAVEANVDRQDVEIQPDLMEHCGEEEEDGGSEISDESEFSELSPAQEIEMIMEFEESLEETEQTEVAAAKGQTMDAHLPLADGAIGQFSGAPLPSVAVPSKEMQSQLEGSPAEVAPPQTQPQTELRAGERMALNGDREETEVSGRNGFILLQVTTSFRHSPAAATSSNLH